MKYSWPIFFLIISCGDDEPSYQVLANIDPEVCAAPTVEDLAPYYEICVTQNLNLIPAYLDYCYYAHSPSFCALQEQRAYSEINKAWLDALLFAGKEESQCLAFGGSCEQCRLIFNNSIYWTTSFCGPAWL